MNKYNQIMEKICVTPVMISRLQEQIGVRLAQQERVRRQKIAGIIAACLVLVVSSTVVAYQSGIQWGQDVPRPPLVSVGGVQEYDSIAHLAENLSFPLSIPTVLPEGYAFEKAVNQFGMAVLIYSNGETQIKYCMGVEDAALVGNNHTDSGYSIDSLQATLFNDTGSGYTSAQWQDDTYSYGIISDIPLSEEMWSDMIVGVEVFE